MTLPLQEEGHLRFLVTVDADWIPGSEVGLLRLLEFSEEEGIPLTVFFTGMFAEQYSDITQEVVRRGHEIGVHGWKHGLDVEENYKTAPYEIQRANIQKATESVIRATGIRARKFRAPYLAISQTLYSALVDCGYDVDSSVPARRLDRPFGGQVGRTPYFRAPLRPYRPSAEHFGREGEGRIVEVPPSAFILPLVMSTLRRAGRSVTNWIKKRVMRRTDVITFYCHPWEFVSVDERQLPPDAPINLSTDGGTNALRELKSFVRGLREEGWEPSRMRDVTAGVPSGNGCQERLEITSLEHARSL